MVYFSPCKQLPRDIKVESVSSESDLPKYDRPEVRENLDVDPIPPDAECTSLRDMCFLATAYASNLGGTGSLTGTGANLLLAGFFRRCHSVPKKDISN